MGSAADNSLASKAENRSATCVSGHTENQKAAGRRVTDVIADYLSSLGVKHIFGVGGANIEDLYDAAYFSDEVTAVLAKHEFSAATMADGYSRAGNGLGVVAATSGGASLNLVAGLGESLASRVPVLALVGQPPTGMDGLGSFQDTSGHNGALDAEALFSAVSVHCERVVDPNHISAALVRAVAAARTGGPAVLLLPKDIQQSSVEADARIHRNRQDVVGNVDLSELARVLGHAIGRVTIVAGEQVARDDAREELERLRALLNARLATVPDAKDVSGCQDRYALGVTGVMGHLGVAEAITQGSACLLVGTRLPLTSRSGLDAALSAVPTLSIGSAPPFVQSTHVHAQDLRTALAQLAASLPGSQSAESRRPRSRHARS